MTKKTTSELFINILFVFYSLNARSYDQATSFLFCNSRNSAIKQVKQIKLEAMNWVQHIFWIYNLNCFVFFALGKYQDA